MSTRLLCTPGRKAGVIFKGWRRLAVYIGVAIRGVERVANSRFGGRENDFVLMGLSHAEVCRFAGL